MMLVETVRKLSPLQRFVYWVKERHQIYLRRRAGKSKPWTDDEVLQTQFFTHPYRELDKTTVWFRENVRDPLSCDQRVLLATVIFRWFNYIPTGEILVAHDLLCDWSSKKALEILVPLRDGGRQMVTGAFMVKSPPGIQKVEGICGQIDGVWKHRNWLVDLFLTRGLEGKATIEGAHKTLLKFYGLGGFMAYEIVCDLRYTMFLSEASDKMTWCNPGPGAIRGMHRLTKTEWEGKGDNSFAPPRPDDWAQRTQDLLKELTKRLPRMPAFEMREVEHSLCEWDKYERVLWGDGRSKRHYNGIS